MNEIKTKNLDGEFIWVPAIIVACANTECREERRPVTVPDDGCPVTCGACGTIIKAGTDGIQ